MCLCVLKFSFGSKNFISIDTKIMLSSNRDFSSKFQSNDTQFKICAKNKTDIDVPLNENDNLCLSSSSEEEMDFYLQQLESNIDITDSSFRKFSTICSKNRKIQNDNLNNETGQLPVKIQQVSENCIPVNIKV